MRTRLGLAAAVGLVVCMLVQAAIGQGELDYTPRMPRPVDAETREMLGYPTPRDPETVLAAFDALTEPPVPEVSPNDPEAERIVVLDAWRQAKYEYHLARVNLVSELEEAGYSGNRLNDLLEAKIVSTNQLLQTNNGLRSFMLGQFWDMRQRYASTPIAVKLEAMEMQHAISGLLLSQLRVAESDFEKIIEIDRKLPFGERSAGSLLMQALGGWRYDETSDVYARWSQWIVDNMPADSSSVRQIMTERRINTPLRVKGVGLDGEAIDTADWKGDVVLVDFWGLWCGPCLAQMPELKAVYEKYRDRGLKLVGVLADWRPDEARKYLAEHGCDWPQIVDPAVTSMKTIDQHSLVKMLNINGFPTVHLIDRDGIQRTMYGVADLEKEVLHWLTTPASTQP